MTRPTTIPTSDVLHLSTMRDREARGASVWEPTTQPSTGVKPIVTPETARVVIEILHWTPIAGESHVAAAGRKEMALRAALTELSPAEGLAVQRRFEADVADDEMVRAFRRFVPERRVRVVRFLQDLRRGRAT